MLIDPMTQQHISLDTSDIPVSTYLINLDSVDPRVQTLLSQFSVLTSPLQLSEARVSNLTTCHHIDTGNSPPIYFKARPLTGEKLKAAKEEFQFLLS